MTGTAATRSGQPGGPATSSGSSALETITVGMSSSSWPGAAVSSDALAGSRTGTAGPNDTSGGSAPGAVESRSLVASAEVSKEARGSDPAPTGEPFRES